MIQKGSSKWVEVWGAEQVQNQILKGLLAFTIALSAVLAIALAVVSLRAPVVVAVSDGKTSVLRPMAASDERVQEEIRRIVTDYVRIHHNWNWQNVNSQLTAASRFVARDFSDEFLRANSTQAKIAKDKKLSQRLYIADLSLDSQQRSVLVQADRILVVEGLRATNPMTLKVSYELGPRTESNPEGVYITAEQLVTDTPAQGAK